MSNPFATDTAEVEDLDLDVDANEVEDTAEDDIEETPKPVKTKADKPAKEKKEPARPPVPEGFITPVAFARVLTAKLHERGHENRNGRIGGDGDECDLRVNPVPPQMVYSYMKNNGPGSKNPLPTHSEGGRDVLLKEDEALEWWIAMVERVQASKVAKAEKDAAKAEKAASKKTEEVAEAEDTSEAEVSEAE